MSRVLPAEWHPQSGVQLTWPHEDMDWGDMLVPAEACFVEIARALVHEGLLVVLARDPKRVQALIGPHEGRIRIIQANPNDVWARDHGGITIFENDRPRVLDFRFNGWGLKFAANRDNQLTRGMQEAGLFAPGVRVENAQAWVLEGGSLESDGQGTLLTTSACLLSQNRNPHLDRTGVEALLADQLGARRVLWLDHGWLAGDDTDSHIDTLARFCDPQTICHVACDDPADEHFEALAQMKAQLQTFRTAEGKPYRLVPLPMAPLLRDADGDRLPSTYANFLITNRRVLLPFYGHAPTDELARQTIASLFPKREVTGIDCSALVHQHGSLHCVTMQYPTGVFE